MKWKQLRRLPSSGALVASITFSNEHYVSDNELPREERTDFVLPGVQWDARTGTYTMKSASGARTAVATVRRRFSVEDIELLPGARLCLVRTGSTVSVQLVSGQPMHRENRSVEVIASWPD